MTPRRPDGPGRLGRLVRSARVSRDVDDELEFHIAGRVDELVEAGWDRERAREEAVRQFGDSVRYRDECRSIARSRISRERRGEVMDQLRQDVRFAVRAFAKSPGFTAVVVLTLGLGIGATTAVFTVAKNVILDPLPFHDPDRLVMVWERNLAQNIERDRPSPPNYADWRQHNRTFEDMAAFADGSVTLADSDQPVVVPVAFVTPNLFDVLGVPARLGRTLRPDDEMLVDDADIRGAGAVVVSERLWRNRFDADPGVVGRTVQLDGVSVEIVGVLPSTFAVPRPDIDLWLPTDYEASSHHRQSRYLTVVGRLAPTVGVEEARDDLDAIQASIGQTYPEANAGWTTDVVPAQDEVVGASTRQILLVLLGAVGFVLLIACANVANLLLGRSETRSREMSIRMALGAGQRRVVGQLLTESLLLAVAGGALGTVLAVGGVDLLLALDPADLPRLDEVAIDSGSIVFAALASMFTAVVFGLAPTVHTTRSSVADNLRGAGGLSGRGQERLRALLVASEVAVSVVLLVGAGLLTRSLVGLRSVDPGFGADHVVVARVNLGSEYATNDDRVRYFDEMSTRLRELPGVQAAGITSVLPMDPAGIDFDLPYLAEGHPARPEGELPQTDYRIASDGYFDAMGMRMVRGRSFEPFDRRETTPVLVINEALAAQLWPGEDPLGKTITLYYVNDRAWEVVGVVGDTRHRGLGAPAPAQLFVPLRQAEFLFGYMHFAVRTDGTPDAVSAIRAVGAEVEPMYPLYSVRPMAEILANTTQRDRFVATLLSCFAFLALGLAAVGIHGVIAYQVTQRSPEIGLRMALGAHRSRVLGEVLSSAGLLAGLGIAVGTVGAVATTRLIGSMLVDVSPLDPVTFSATALILLLVALGAALVPALRAARLDPARALRGD